VNPIKGIITHNLCGEKKFVKETCCILASSIFLSRFFRIGPGEVPGNDFKLQRIGFMDGEGEKGLFILRGRWGTSPGHF
jgi:hypothetical protein